MSSISPLTIDDMRTIFREEIGALNGRVLSIRESGRRLYCRATLPLLGEVAPGDRVRGGVALRAAEPDALVCPYVLRILCVNGLIVRRSLEAHDLKGLAHLPTAAADWTLREAIRTSCAEEAFNLAVEEMRAARRRRIERLIHAMDRHLRRDITGGADLLPGVMDRFDEENDRSAFGLMNAVTALARDTADPELRWQLEALGGAIADGSLATPPTRGDRFPQLVRRELLRESVRRRGESEEVNPRAREQPCQVDSLA